MLQRRLDEVADERVSFVDEEFLLVLGDELDLRDARTRLVAIQRSNGVAVLVIVGHDWRERRGERRGGGEAAEQERRRREGTARGISEAAAAVSDKRAAVQQRRREGGERSAARISS